MVVMYIYICISWWSDSAGNTYESTTRNTSAIRIGFGETAQPLGWRLRSDHCWQWPYHCGSHSDRWWSAVIRMPLSLWSMVTLSPCPGFMQQLVWLPWPMDGTLWNPAGDASSRAWCDPSRDEFLNVSSTEVQRLGHLGMPSVRDWIAPCSA